MALAFLRQPLGQLAVWVVVAGSSFGAGRSEALARASRRHAVASTPYSPSRRSGWMAGVELRITGWPRNRKRGWSAPAVIHALGQEIRCSDRLLPRIGDGVLLRGSGPAPPFWSIVAGGVQGRLPASAGSPGGFDNARYLSGRNLLWEGRLKEGATCELPPGMKAGWPDLAGAMAGWLTRLRMGIQARLNTLLPTPEATVAASVLLGARDISGDRARVPFARLGLAHLFAVSGLHVGILLAILMAITRPLALGPLPRLGLTLCVLPLYSVLTGMSGSVLRASGLATVVLAAPVCGRRCCPLYTLGLLFWLNCQAAPWSIIDTGCRLSYLAAMGIVGVHRLLGGRLRKRPAWRHWILAGLAVTVSAQWFTLPEIAASFGWMNPLAPLINLVAVPVFGAAIWCVVLGAMLSLIWCWPAEALAALGWILLRLLSGGAGLAARHVQVVGLPVWGPGRLSIFLAASALLLWLLSRLGGRSEGHQPGRWLVAVLLAVGLLWWLPQVKTGKSSASVTAVQFAVEQGDCGLLQFQDGWTVLIDTGVAWPGGSALAWNVLPWLQRQGIRHLDAVLLSHGHADHTGGLAELVAQCEVGVWWLGGSLNVQQLPASAAGKVQMPRHGEVLHRCQEWSLRCLYPAKAEAGEWSENDQSLVVVLERAAQALAIWSGDLEEGGERALLREPLADCGTGLQFWKAGHHGSNTSGCDAFLDWIRPRCIVVSCGVENRYRHPSHGPYVVAGDTVPVLRTDLDGTILLRWDAAGEVSWRCQRGGSGRLAADGAAP